MPALPVIARLSARFSPRSAAPDLASLLDDCTGMAAADALRRLVAAGVDRAPAMPLPGSGATLARWRTLAAVGARDLSLAKLFEGHTDALAILAESGAGASAGDATVWATWCAEPPDAVLELAGDPATGWVVNGRKAWCSGARAVDCALVSCRDAAGAPRLAAVDLRQPGVRFDDGPWCAVGMQGSASIDVHFEQATARAVGAPGFYVERPGFWHGGAGVAACWFGAAGALAEALQLALGARPGAPDPHRAAQLGHISVALAAAAALLRQTAAQIDAAPLADAMAAALGTRLAVEDAATLTLACASRALGPGPFCKDARLARLFADLPVFMRQSHAERDQAALGMCVAGMQGHCAPWRL